MEEAVVDREPEDLEKTFIFANKRLYLTIRQYDGGYGFTYLDNQGQVKMTSELPLTGKTIKPPVLSITADYNTEHLNAKGGKKFLNRLDLARYGGMCGNRDKSTR